MAVNRTICALKTSNVQLDQLAVNCKKSGNIAMITHGKDTLTFQSTYLTVASTITKTNFPNIHQLETVFRGKRQHRFFTFIEEFETAVANLVAAVKTEWFTKQNIIIKSLIKERTLSDNTTEFYMRWPFDVTKDIFIDEEKNPFDPERIVPGDQIRICINDPRFWMQDNQCGLIVPVQKIMVKPYTEPVVPVSVTNVYVFNSDSAESESESESESEPEDNSMISLLATETKPTAAAVVVPVIKPKHRPIPVPPKPKKTIVKKLNVHYSPASDISDIDDDL